MRNGIWAVGNDDACAAGSQALDGLLSVVATLQRELDGVWNKLGAESMRCEIAEARVATLQQERDEAMRRERHIREWATTGLAGALRGDYDAELVAVRERETRLREALAPFLAHPRWLSIGSYHNTVEVRVSAKAFDRALVVSSQPGAPLTEPDQGRDNGTAGEEVPQDARTGSAGAAPPSGSVSVSQPGAAEEAPAAKDAALRADAGRESQFEKMRAALVRISDTRNPVTWIQAVGAARDALDDGTRIADPFPHMRGLLDDFLGNEETDHAQPGERAALEAPQERGAPDGAIHPDCECPDGEGCAKAPTDPVSLKPYAACVYCGAEWCEVDATLRAGKDCSCADVYGCLWQQLAALEASDKKDGRA